jgi:DNA helicase IV
MAYTFSLPSITELSSDQKIALNARVEDVFIISGCPGSGKTTVALLRAKGKGNDPQHHYTVWANMLYGYLLNLASQLEVSEQHFSTFFSWFWSKYKTFGLNYGKVDVNTIVSKLENSRTLYKELQLDEGQDLPVEVRSALSLITKKMIICMDPAQDVKDICSVEVDEIQRTENLLLSYGKNVKKFKLGTNWRNTRPIFDFARSIVPELNSQTNTSDFAKKDGKKPMYYEVQGFDNIVNKIVEIIKNEPGRNIGILDDSLERLHLLKDRLIAADITPTLYDSKEQRLRTKNEKRHFLMSMSNVVLSTFISCKGLEFNTVIINDMTNLEDSLGKKKGYYVGCTRAQDRLIIFKDTTNYRVPNWFQQIDRELYETNRPKDNTNPF